MKYNDEVVHQKSLKLGSVPEAISSLILSTLAPITSTSVIGMLAVIDLETEFEYRSLRCELINLAGWSSFACISPFSTSSANRTDFREAVLRILVTLGGLGAGRDLLSRRFSSLSEGESSSLEETSVSGQDAVGGRSGKVPSTLSMSWISMRHNQQCPSRAIADSSCSQIEVFEGVFDKKSCLLHNAVETGLRLAKEDGRDFKAHAATCFCADGLLHVFKEAEGRKATEQVN